MLSRLLEMVYILMDKKRVTATELAERFEVSTRTIYRYIDALSEAGIPVYASRGRYGGISLTEHFVLDRMLITPEEQQQILAALTSLQETGAQEEAKTLRKLGEFFRTVPVNWLAIDLSDWSGTRRKLYEDIRQAIISRRYLEFDYYGQRHEAQRRRAAPLQLLFKEYTWYLRAYCMDRKAMRTFKLVRMKDIVLSDETFVPDSAWYQEIMDPVGGNDGAQETEITICIDQREAYRVYDRFEDAQIEVLEDGSFLVRAHYFLDDWVYGLLLSFGASAEVLSPEHVRAEIKRRISRMSRRYQQGDGYGKDRS